MADELQGGVCGEGNIWNISRNFLGSSPCSMVVNDMGWLPNNHQDYSMFIDSKSSSSKSNPYSTDISSDGFTHMFSSTSNDMWNHSLLFHDVRTDDNCLEILQETTCLNSSMMNYLQETSFIDCPQIVADSSMISHCNSSSFVSQKICDIDSQLQEFSSPKNNPIVSSNSYSCMASMNSGFNQSSMNDKVKPNLPSFNLKNNEFSVAKRPRIEPLPTFKVRKEKFGDRVTALQQLVSPFGKTDTASVLHEAIEYIKFLHDQVKTLSAPYLGNGSPPMLQLHKQVNNDQEELKLLQDLTSRGLCLVPMSTTFAIEAENSADLWAPMFGPC